MAISPYNICQQYHLQIFSTSFILLITSLLLTMFPMIIISDDQSLAQQQHSGCEHKCGSIDVPFPFYVNNPSSPPACGLVSLPDAFRLSCFQLKNSTPSLFLSIHNNISKTYQVLQFFPDGILVDFPSTVTNLETATTATSISTSSSCRQYNDLNSFGFEGNDYFGISTDNVLSLYDCKDSSLCRTDCEKITTVLFMPPGCNHSSSATSAAAACCYPLSDYTSWRPGDGFPIFSHFGCKGFSSWVVVPSGNNINARRGVKLEWAFPDNNNSSKGGVTTTFCTPNAYIVNATTVTSGIRCICQDGFAGDGFAQGFGCLKSCLKDGEETYGRDCYMKRHGRRKLEVLAGLLTSAFFIASLTALFCLLKRPTKSGTAEPNKAKSRSAISFREACRTRLLTYHELEEAIKGFEDCQKLVEGTKGKLYAGVLRDGSNVVVHKVQCESERDFIQVLSQVELLSAVSHRNMACLLGCSIDSGDTPLVVYEYPANGTLLQQLRQSREQKIGLDWFKRLNIATETASVLAFLQYEISPPILHHDLQSGCILLDEDFSVKIAGFELLNASLEGDGSHLYTKSEGLQYFYRSDVYNLGVVLLEIIAGATPLDLPTIALQKIRSGKLEEIVDPLLYYHEQPAFRREQIEKVADLATRCLLFGGDGKLGMIDAARELVHIRKDTVAGGSRRGPALEETFSNSSLLQMISMSPDSIYVP